MGCDIHGVLQKRGPKEGEWTTFASIDRFFDGRSYLLFGILAGVRNQDVEVISDHRGLPEGFEGDTEGQHNLGHCTFKEFLDYNWTQMYIDYDGESTPLGELFTWLHLDVYKICTEEKTQPEDIRIVFGFDS